MRLKLVAGAIAMIGAMFGALAPAGAAAKIWVPADGEQIVFAVHNGDKKIGSMKFAFGRPDDDTLVVTRSQSVATRKFMMKVSMEQMLVETWRGEELESMTTDLKVKTPVQDMIVDASYTRRSDGVLIYKNQDDQYQVEAGLWPSTLWHGKFLKRQSFFQPPNGKRVDIEFDYQGKDETVGCHRFVAKSVPEEGDAADFTLWFYGNGKPCRMQFQSAVGVLTYVSE